MFRCGRPNLESVFLHIDRKGVARLIVPIIRTAMVSLRRDRAALALSFILPIAFFSIFAVIFGGRRDTVPKITVIVVDEDQSHASQELVKGLEREGSLVIRTRPKSEQQRCATAGIYGGHCRSRREGGRCAGRADRSPWLRRESNFLSRATKNAQRFSCSMTAATWWRGRWSRAFCRRSP